MSIVQNLLKLPEIAFAAHPSDPRVTIAMRRGIPGYYPINTNLTPDQLNEGRATPDQVEAMRIGSAFGWDVKGADPDYIRMIRERKDQAA